MENEQNKGVQVVNSPAFKLKDRPLRQYQAINLKKQFGFIPEIIVIEKVRRYNNAFFVRAVVPEKELKKREKLQVQKETNVTTQPATTDQKTG